MFMQLMCNADPYEREEVETLNFVPIWAQNYLSFGLRYEYCNFVPIWAKNLF